MACIEAIRDCGMLLGSGNIVGYPGQTLEQLADDILLMKKLEIHWAPIIPFMPAAGTPLADEGGGEAWTGTGGRSPSCAA